MSEKERLQLENELLMTCSKAQAINKYIDELEESSKLSELWCKSQQENQKYKEVINKSIEIIKEYKECNWSKYDENEIEIELIDKILEILKGDNDEIYKN